MHPMHAETIFWWGAKSPTKKKLNFFFFKNVQIYMKDTECPESEEKSNYRLFRFFFFQRGFCLFLASMGQKEAKKRVRAHLPTARGAGALAAWIIVPWNITGNIKNKLGVLCDERIVGRGCIV